MFNDQFHDHYPPSYAELHPQTVTFSLDTGEHPTGQHNQQGRRLSNKPPRPKRYGCKLCGSLFDRPCSLSQHFRTHTREKPYACEACHHSFTTTSNLYRHKRICTRRLANALRFPEPLVTSPQTFSFVYEDPSKRRRRRRRRAPESDQELIGLSNEYMNDEDHYGPQYDVDTDEAILAYHEGQGEHPHSTGAYHPHQYLPYHVPDHVHVDARPTSPHIHQQLCDEAVYTSTNPTVDAPAGEIHYQPITHANLYRSSMTSEDQITHVELYASNMNWGGADGQGQGGSSLGVSHAYHPLHYPQPNWHDERYYWGYANHEVTWTLAAFNEYRQLAPMQYDIHNACAPHDVRYPHYG